MTHTYNISRLMRLLVVSNNTNSEERVLYAFKKDSAVYLMFLFDVGVK